MKNFLINKNLSLLSRFPTPIFLILLLMLLASCNRQPHESAMEFTVSEHTPAVAKGFRLYDGDGFRVLDLVRQNDPNTLLQRFYLVSRAEAANFETPPDGQLLPVPLKDMVCLSATHLSFADALGLVSKISGVASADYVVSAEFKDFLTDGRIQEIGISDHFKLEKLISLAPEIVMVTHQQGQSVEPLRNAGLTVLAFAEHLETHPLGRAEWIRCMGALFGRETQAAAIFDSISNEYHRLTVLASKVEVRPLVLSGKQYGGFWNLAGGHSYLAQMLHDAGAAYIWSDNPDSGSLILDFETVYHRGINAGFWRFLVFSREPYTYDHLLAEDQRYAGIGAFRDKKVLISNTFEKPYFQKGVLEPQVILADYISIFHPELLPEHQPVYYQLLK
jgi:iron complex transport system substrate-binding protein